MRLFALRRQLLGVFIVLILVQGSFIALTYKHIRSFTRTRIEMRHRPEIHSELVALEATLIDAETGLRGFVITGREEFLQPYRAAARLCKGRMERLHTLVQQAAQRQRLERLASLLGTIQQQMQSILETRRRDGFEPAQKLISDGAQKEMMDQLRAVVAEMDAIEQLETQTHEQEQLQSASAFVKLVFFGLQGNLLLSCVFGLLLFSRLQKLAQSHLERLQHGYTPLAEAAASAAQEAKTLTTIQEQEGTATAEVEAALEIIAHTARDLSTVAMEMTSSARAIAEESAAAPPAQRQAETERITMLAARTAQIALSIELTTADQRRLWKQMTQLEAQLAQSAQNTDQVADEITEASKQIKEILEGIAGALPTPTGIKAEGANATRNGRRAASALAEDEGE